MNFQALELNVMFIWINLELAILSYAFFGFKIKRIIKKRILKIKKAIGDKYGKKPK